VKIPVLLLGYSLPVFSLTKGRVLSGNQHMSAEAKFLQYELAGAFKNGVGVIRCLGEFF
jgi:hypothetical protein|tara:strand:- start:3000 stop:3176 length:177 start_codon:yes stop_codon:yes gene_type:complete